MRRAAARCGRPSTLINRCTLLIADEPTGNLDSKTGEEILGLFRQLNREDGTSYRRPRNTTHTVVCWRHADRVHHPDTMVMGSSSDD